MRETLSTLKRGVVKGSGTGGCTNGIAIRGPRLAAAGTGSRSGTESGTGSGSVAGSTSAAESRAKETYMRFDALELAIQRIRYLRPLVERLRRRSAIVRVCWRLTH